jgi:hypothetical protein
MKFSLLFIVVAIMQAVKDFQVALKFLGLAQIMVHRPWALMSRPYRWWYHQAANSTLLWSWSETAGRNILVSIHLRRNMEHTPTHRDLARRILAENLKVCRHCPRISPASQCCTKGINIRPSFHVCFLTNLRRAKMQPK